MNGGRGQIARINMKELHQNIVAPGLTFGDGVKTEGLLLSTGASILAYLRKTPTEPKLHAYATSGRGNFTVPAAPAAVKMVPQTTHAVANSGTGIIPRNEVPTVPAKMVPRYGENVVENLVPAPLNVTPDTGRFIAHHSAHSQLMIFVNSIVFD